MGVNKFGCAECKVDKYARLLDAINANSVDVMQHNTLTLVLIAELYDRLVVCPK